MCTFSSCANIVQAQEVGRASSYTAATSNLLIVVVWNLVVIAKRLLVILGNRFNFFNLFIVDGNIFIHQPPHHWKQLCLQEPPCRRWKRLRRPQTLCYCWKPHWKHQTPRCRWKIHCQQVRLGGQQHCSCQVASSISFSCCCCCYSGSCDVVFRRLQAGLCDRCSKSLP